MLITVLKRVSLVVALVAAVVTVTHIADYKEPPRKRRLPNVAVVEAEVMIYYEMPVDW